ncbi:PH domain-containing protein [Patescibacteria group bacterium]|nr:MAG: PH domain-containing protein [Patescibacteria group bacterium]
MNPEETTTDQDEQPVAYDTAGHPLYMHPAQVQPEPQPISQSTEQSVTRPEAMVASQAVHMAQPVEEEKPFVSDATKVKHDRSKQLYPTLNLSEGEYVIAVVKRHPIGLFLSFGIGLILTTVVISALFNYDLVVQFFRLKGAAADINAMALPLVALVLLICLMTYIAYYIYTNNRFYLTNESIIDQMQISLFAHTEKSIDLASIEDISYTQTNILQGLINYGSIKLSTIGDETTYRYTFVSNPKECVSTLNSAVEAFKNGRPISV